MGTKTFIIDHDQSPQKNLQLNVNLLQNEIYLFVLELNSEMGCGIHLKGEAAR